MLVLAVATGIAYANTFQVPYLFDDFLAIRDNATIRHFSTAWSPPAGDGITVSGRPLLNLSLALNYAISGSEVWSYHALNLLIHVLAGWVLFDVVRRTLRQPSLAPRFGRDANALAAVASLLWSLHPLQTESVTYLVQRAESLAGLMYLLVLWGFVRATEPRAARPRAWLGFSVLACLLGMAAKETVATAPVIVLLYDRLFVAGSWREVGTRRWPYHLGLGATWVLLAYLVFSTGGRGGSVGFSGEISAGSYALTQVGAVFHYLCLVAWPWPLVFDYGTAVAGGWSEVGWQGLVLAALLGGSLWAWWRRRPESFAGLFFFVVLAPSSSFVPVVTQTVSEHRMYLALAAPVVLLAVGLHRGLGRTGLLVVGAAAAFGLGGVTLARNHTYRTELSIWEDTVAKRPDNVRALVTLGSLYQLDNRLDEARTLLRRAVEVAPGNAEAWNNLGNVWLVTREWDRAIECFQRALALKPNQSPILNNLGMTLNQAGRPAEAIEQLAAALKFDPALDDTRLYLAGLLIQSRRLAEAEPHLVIYLRNRPDDGVARANYGNVLMALGRANEGIAQYTRALQNRPDDADLQNALGLALARQGRLAEAVPHFREAVRLDPNHPRARQNLERAEQSLGRR